MRNMSRKVLLVDVDVDALGALASALRARGLTVFNASEAFEAVEQAFQRRPDVVLAARGVEGSQDLIDAFRVVPEIADLPLLFLVDDADATLAGDEVPRANVDLVISRVIELSPREPDKAPAQEIRGNVEQMPLVDLVQMLAMNRRSGLLAATTSNGAGEVRIDGGEVVDAVFRRLEGEKALYRLLGERDGRFAFTPGEASGPRRITSSTSMLLMEAMRQVDELRRRRKELAPNNEALLFEEISQASPRPDPSGPPSPLAREVVQLLQIPRSIDELLDELPAPDLELLDVVARLSQSGKLRLVPIAELTTPFATPEQLPVLRSLVSRLARPGFQPPPRFVIAASAKRMPALAHAIRRITDAIAPNEPPPRAALPRALGTLRLGDGVDLALTGLPGDEAFAPTWSLALPGAAAVVRLGEAGGKALEAYCESLEITLLEAESVMGEIDVAVPTQVAALVRSTLELVSGVG